MPQARTQGIPDYALGSCFEQALQDFYQFNQVPIAEVENASALVLYGNSLHPIQTAMLAQTGRCLPILCSLEEPLPQAQIRKIGIVQGTGFFSDLEVSALTSWFEQADVECRVWQGQEVGIDGFKELYQDPSLDVIWVSSHGHYDHWDPKSPGILLSDGCVVSVDDLAQLELKRKEQRLLFLNICDGGTSPVLGAVPRLGMAASLAAKEQVVISHQWPVQPLLATVFGLAVARTLVVPGEGFFDAFKEALILIRRPWEDILDDMEEIGIAELTERMANNPIDTSNIFHWGSPCFFI